MRPRLFTAEIICIAPVCSCLAWRFNEAAAIHRGNRGKNIAVACGNHASMRPRLFTAEIGFADAPNARTTHASMRPRLFTAEIASLSELAMRGTSASMRPRLFTAEINGPTWIRSSSPSFNEAAAIHRGNRIYKPSMLRVPVTASMRPRLFTAEIRVYFACCINKPCASMRPRLFTAEILAYYSRIWARPGCFNEAAAIHRGNRIGTSRLKPYFPRFNEAAAIHRGNQRLPGNPWSSPTPLQ